MIDSVNTATATAGAKVSVKPQIDRSKPPKFLTRFEAAIVSTLGLRSISEAIARGHLQTVRIGDRRIIRLEDLESFLGSRLG